MSARRSCPFRAARCRGRIRSPLTVLRLPAPITAPSGGSRSLERVNASAGSGARGLNGATCRPVFAASPSLVLAALVAACFAASGSRSRRSSTHSVVGCWSPYSSPISSVGSCRTESSCRRSSLLSSCRRLRDPSPNGSSPRSGPDGFYSRRRADLPRRDWHGRRQARRISRSLARRSVIVALFARLDASRRSPRSSILALHGRPVARSASRSPRFSPAVRRGRALLRATRSSTGGSDSRQRSARPSSE